MRERIELYQAARDADRLGPQNSDLPGTPGAAKTQPREASGRLVRD
jgi:hypothetical protein